MVVVLLMTARINVVLMLTMYSTYLQTEDMLQLYISLGSVSCCDNGWGLVRFRHNSHLVRVRQIVFCLTISSSVTTNVAGNVPDILLRTSSGFRLTDVETLSQSVVSGLAAVSMMLLPSPPPPDLKISSCVNVIWHVMKKCQSVMYDKYNIRGLQKCPNNILATGPGLTVKQWWTLLQIDDYDYECIMSWTQWAQLQWWQRQWRWENYWCTQHYWWGFCRWLMRVMTVMRVTAIGVRTIKTIMMRMRVSLTAERFSVMWRGGFWSQWQWLWWEWKRWWLCLQ